MVVSDSAGGSLHDTELHKRTHPVVDANATPAVVSNTPAEMLDKASTTATTLHGSKLFGFTTISPSRPSSPILITVSS
jgi:hypothetical protein